MFPAFDDLPMLPNSQIRHSWEVFSDSLNLGTLNRITDATTLAALECVTLGRRISLSLPLDIPFPSMFGREAVQHKIFEPSRNILDDRLDNLFTQASTQWDGLRHIRAREDGFFGGWQGNHAKESEPLGIHHWSKGIIGRGVLIDIFEHFNDSSPYDPFESLEIDAATISQIAAKQRVEFRHGDVLLFRTGWIKRYLNLETAARVELSERSHSSEGLHWAGLSGEEETSRFLWNIGAAVVVADNPAVEVAPGRAEAGSLHRRLIPALGFPLGELFDLEGISAHCNATGRYDFLFVSVPLNVRGGVGTPASAAAVV